MGNKYGAQRCWWHPKAGYFFKKEELEEYYKTFALFNQHIGIDEFTVFDSRFEAGIHDILCQFVKKHSDLRLFSQIQIDLSCQNFCKLGYKVDFLIARQLKLKGKAAIKPLVEDRGIPYNSIANRPDIASNYLLIEAKGCFTAEARYKHLLLEWRGIQHGQKIEIVQLQSQYVARGNKCYRTLTPVELLDKLSKRFPLPKGDT